MRADHWPRAPKPWMGDEERAATNHDVCFADVDAARAASIGLARNDGDLLIRLVAMCRQTGGADRRGSSRGARLMVAREFARRELAVRPEHRNVYPVHPIGLSAEA
ncbi:hypothetical protein E2R23_05920 [Burkholderia pseudomallei]|nr:hypothetical protein CNX72_28650 [Burkholderia pseudomallei]MWA35442.1 hypothetical protein [Burkholderia pseudomallei]QBI39449.1 hypothetical protein EXY28_05895 [Burkholderia pseudomallei]QBI46135.1 hypothetical protein EXY72_05930 [Burkholderia pseudomallei]QBL77419.1 hypothetical protein EYA82_05955 [Burkholderia pseudomallei]